MQRLGQFQAVTVQPLPRRQQAVEDADGDGDTGRDVGSGQEPGLAPMQIDPAVFVKRGEAVQVLVIADGLGDGHVLGIGGDVGDG